MRRARWVVASVLAPVLASVGSVLLLSSLAIIASPVFLQAQGNRIAIAAGSPEDKALQAITAEPDPQKKLAMYQDFVQQFSANPAAVAYGNWQIAQLYQNTNDLQKALEYGDKALASSPDNVDILVMQTNLAQQLKDNAKVMAYAVRGGQAYNANLKSAEQAAPDNSTESYQFLEAAAFNVIVDENDAKKRMAYIESFTPAFPKSRFEDAVAQYAMVALSQLNDMSRLVSYGEKSLAANPNSLPTLLLLANAYVDDPKPGSLPKAITYAQKTIAVAKADAPDADSSRKLSAGVAHSTLGYAYMKQDKTVAAVPELKAAVALLKGQPDQLSVALYRLGYAYAKLNKVNEAREILTEAVKIPGPVQQPAQDLLTKVNAARARGR